LLLHHKEKQYILGQIVLDLNHQIIGKTIEEQIVTAFKNLRLA
jgi:hypothetical protein